MLRELRKQVNDVLTIMPARRKPALRRSDDGQALLATDLPLVADGEVVEAFAAKLTEQGWRVFPAANGWLLLDAEVPVPQIPEAVRTEGEPACCISLLQRHPGQTEAHAFIRALVKAAEAGTMPFERLCAGLHGEMAAMLRRHEPLPASLLPYLYQAVHDLTDRRKDE